VTEGVCRQAIGSLVEPRLDLIQLARIRIALPTSIYPCESSGRMHHLALFQPYGNVKTYFFSVYVGNLELSYHSSVSYSTVVAF
jgi:hypothetical protein